MPAGPGGLAVTSPWRFFRRPLLPYPFRVRTPAPLSRVRALKYSRCKAAPHWPAEFSGVSLDAPRGWFRVFGPGGNVLAI